MEKEVDVVTIDDKSYLVMKEVTNGTKTFLYLSNINDEDDTLIRKVDENDQNTVVPLESDQEFELACNLLLKSVAN